MIDIHTIGAGGGSIAAIDSGGRLTVGPRAPVPIPARSATARAAPSRPSPTPTWSSGRIPADAAGGAVEL